MPRQLGFKFRPTGSHATSQGLGRRVPAHLPPMQPLRSSSARFSRVSSGSPLVQRKATILLLLAVFLAYCALSRRRGGGGLYPGAAQPCQTQPLLTSERDRKYTTQILHLSPLCPGYRPQLAQSFQPSIRASWSRDAVPQESIKTWKLFQGKGKIEWNSFSELRSSSSTMAFV